jgi:hypothetical protein
MKTKEAIRNELLRCMDFVWQDKTSGDRNSLAQLMIEELCNELYLLYNKLNESDSAIFEKLVKNLSPDFNYVRPAHAILCINPEHSVFELDKRAEFYLKDVSSGFKNRGINAIVFTPALHLKIRNIRIDRIFFEKAKFNTVWLGLSASPEIKTIQDWSFYFEFPHLEDYHEYYDLLSTLQWSAGGKTLKVKVGLPRMENDHSSPVETDVLNFYHDHFQTIESPISLSDIPSQKFPNDLAGVIDLEKAASFPSLYWFSVSFPPQFNPADIEKLLISPNAFPVINRHRSERVITEQEMAKAISLSSGIDEVFLEMDTVADGTFTIEPIRKETEKQPQIADYLEKLVDMLQEEKAAFPKIDKEKVMEVYNSISSINEKEDYKVGKNWLQEYSEVARITFDSTADANDINLSYWTSFAGLVNGVPEKTVLMANKIPELSKADAVLLTTVRGGRDFCDFESMQAVSRFYLTSHDRIITKQDMLNFCRIELGKYIEDVDVEKTVRMSHIQNKGLTNVIEIRITPCREYAGYLRNSGILKDLRIRLTQRSPHTFNYRIVLPE